MKPPIHYIALAAALSLGCDKSAPADPAPTAEPTPSAAPTAEAPPSEPDKVASAAPAPSAAPEAPDNPAEKPAAKVGAKPAPVAKAVERKVKTVRGTSASGTGFAVSIQARSPVRSGESAAATIVLTSKEPFKCNEKYPYKMKLDAPSGVTYASQVVRGASISKKTTTLGIPFTAASKGKATISGTFSFSVCTDDKCLIEKRPLSISLDVD